MYEMPTGVSAAKPKHVVESIVAVVVCLIFVLSIWLAVSMIGKASLHKQLMRDWSRVESSGDVYYTLELDFSEDEIEYNFESLYYDDQLETFDYKVVSHNKFKVDGRVFTVDFNDEKTMMIITPALTSTDASENWFYH